MIVDGRKVYIGNGPKTQTVRVCDANNRRGVYDWVVRLFPPMRVTEAEVAARPSVADLVDWLKSEKRGEVEREPPDEPGPSLPPAEPVAPPTVDSPWVEQAVAVVELAIDQLTHEFLRAPFLHRVEHSLHARLLAILAAQPHLAREFPLADGRTLTQPVHKEWPETVPAPDCRRGNFDLAVLPPEALARASVDAFRRGRVAPPIAIEVGLDYGAGHLAADAEKLIQSGVRYGYLIHFTRRGDTDDRIEQLVSAPGDNIRTAFASVVGGERRYKLLRDPDIALLPGAA